MEELNILPQKIYQFKCDPKLLEDTQKKICKIKWHENGFNSISENGYLQKDESFTKIHNWFHKCLIKVKEEVQFQATDIKITQSWANRQYYQQFHNPHKHPNSVFSGIFYLSHTNTGTTFLLKSVWQMYDHINGLSGQPLHYWNPDDRGMVEYTVEEEPGKLIIFPSILEHGVKPMMEDNIRYTMAFNSFLCGKIGEYGMFNELIIDIK